MTPEQQKKFNTTFGGIFLSVGIIAWLLTFYFAMTPNAPAPAPMVAAPSVDLESCRAALGQMGFSASVKDREVTAFQSLGESPKNQLETASIATLMCKLPLKSFCMGDGCDQPGLTIVMRKPLDKAALDEASNAAAEKEKASKAVKPGKEGGPESASTGKKK